MYWALTKKKGPILKKTNSNNTRIVQDEAHHFGGHMEANWVCLD
jgi:hypothetical protein